VSRPVDSTCCPSELVLGNYYLSTDRGDIPVSQKIFEITGSLWREINTSIWHVTLLSFIKMKKCSGFTHL